MLLAHPGISSQLRGKGSRGVGVEAGSGDGQSEEKCCPDSSSTTPPPSGLDMELGRERLFVSWSLRSWGSLHPALFCPEKGRRYSRRCGDVEATSPILVFRHPARPPWRNSRRCRSRRRSRCCQGRHPSWPRLLETLGLPGPNSRPPSIPLIPHLSKSIISF